MQQQENPQSNLLAREQSPYLLQHAYNPVQWMPWGQEAWDRAQQEDKPVFLSIGYATCHWCHVMAHESFEDQQVADLINQAFIPVKVDREERPDIDAVYMKACQIVSGRGGWPLSIFLTPEKKPFLAATYIPKHSQPPQQGLLELIPVLQDLWQNQRQKVLDAAQSITKALLQSEQDTRGPMPDQGLLEQAVQDMQRNFDQQYGGFGTAPKFPAPHNLLFLLGRYQHTGNQELLSIVEKTLHAMRQGGLFDHLGYGFHRYSTDRIWLVPHFEKMLYDQALLTLAYLRAYQITGQELYAETAAQTLEYAMQDLLSPEGGFCSGEDADSEGVEGKFYLWSKSEIQEVLSEQEAQLAIQAFDLQDQGNFLEESTQERTAENILHRLSISEQELAENLGLELQDLRHRLQAVRQKLLAERNKRVRPQLDDKILTDWNGLMLAALASAGRILQSEDYTRAANNTADFLLQNMQDEHGRLLHRYRQGQAGIPGFLDDYAFLAWGLLELFRTSADQQRLEQAKSLISTAREHFRDEKQGGFYLNAQDSEIVLYRPREIFDGAIPSGNSALLYNLAWLQDLKQDSGYREQVQELLQAFSGLVKKHPTGFTHFLSGLDMSLNPQR
ncbi:MAG: thioredoxin domain-containing protein [Desulfohalobiaceae bacterium]